MTKTEFVAAYAEELGISKSFAKELVNVFFDMIINKTKEHKAVKIPGFGAFSLSPRKARMGVNPKNPSQRIQIPAMNVVVFRAGTNFKKEVRN